MEPESELSPPLVQLRLQPTNVAQAPATANKRGPSSGYSQQTWLQLRLQPTNVAPAFDRFPSAFAAGYIGKIKLFLSQKKKFPVGFQIFFLFPMF